MSHDQTFLAPGATAYLERAIGVPHATFEAIEREVRAEGQPAVGRITGGLLRALVATHGARRVLEVGCNLGYSALWMADGLGPGGRVDTIEIDEELARRARAHFDASGQGERLRIMLGAALDVLPRLDSGSYDVIFLDAVKSELPRYLDHALRLIRPGGVIVADNLFWHGRVWDETQQDPDTRGVRAYTERIFSDVRLVSTIVPSEDGLGVSVFQP